MPNQSYHFRSVLLALVSLSSPAWAEELKSTQEDQKAIAVTIYNQDLALIKDQRLVKLSPGSQSLAIRDVSAQIRPETALLRSISQPGSLFTSEQNFDFDLLTPQKMLEKYVGKQVSIARTNNKTGEESIENATVLSANNGVVLKIGNRIETGIPGRLIYPDVPENLRDRPTLVTSLLNQGPNAQTIELSYLTGGLSWKADYVAELSPKEDSIDLSGWVTLTNTSGASYPNAKLQLVAGDVNRVHQNIRPMMKAARDMAVMAEMASAPMAEESLLEYHLYTLDHPTTIAENQTKQVALLNASHVHAKKELLFQGSDYYYQSSVGDLGQKLKAAIYIEFENKEASKLGLPLPKGVMRVYKKDQAGNAQFIGEDQIDHTPKNETIKLKLGEAFDVNANKKQTDFKLLPRVAKGQQIYESAYEFTFKNAKKERVTVTVQEPIHSDWKMLSESHSSTKLTSNTVAWKIDIPAEGSTTLKYRVQVKY